MTFGQRVRVLRHAKEWSLRDWPKKSMLASLFESGGDERLNFGDYPSDSLIHRLADALEADEEELLILAKRVPEPVKQRFFQRPDVFCAIAKCDDDHSGQVHEGAREKEKFSGQTKRKQHKRELSYASTVRLQSTESQRIELEFSMTKSNEHMRLGP